MSLKIKQRGAMFGLDARVALIVFTVLTLVSGYAGIKAYSQIKAQSFVTELQNISKAAAQLELDLRANIFDSISKCMGGPVWCGATNYINSFNALYLSDVLNDATMWNGPYITHSDSIADRFGAPRIYKLNSSYASCAQASDCYNWLYLPNFKANSTVVEIANESIDGSSEVSASTSGRFRYSDNGDGTYLVQFRLGKTLYY